MLNQEPPAEQEPLLLHLNVAMEDADDEEVDRLTRQLLREIEDLNVESAQLDDSGVVPEGAKGDPITIGSIMVAVLPTTLPALVTLVGDWMKRAKGRRVKFKGEVGGSLIEFEGASEDLQVLLKQLSKPPQPGDTKPPEG